MYVYIYIYYIYIYTCQRLQLKLAWKLIRTSWWSLTIVLFQIRKNGRWTYVRAIVTSGRLVQGSRWQNATVVSTPTSTHPNLMSRFFHVCICMCIHCWLEKCVTHTAAFSMRICLELSQKVTLYILSDDSLEIGYAATLKWLSPDSWCPSQPHISWFTIIFRPGGQIPCLDTSKQALWSIAVVTKLISGS